MPRLTLKMAALIQGFPKEWQFAGKKTPAYPQDRKRVSTACSKGHGYLYKKNIETI